MIPIGTFSEPGELSGTEADGFRRPPLCFHASNRIIASFSVISLVMRGAWSPSRMGVSRAPISRYTIRTLWPAEHQVLSAVGAVGQARE